MRIGDQVIALLRDDVLSAYPGWRHAPLITLRPTAPVGDPSPGPGRRPPSTARFLAAATRYAEQPARSSPACAIAKSKSCVFFAFSELFIFIKV